MDNQFDFASIRPKKPRQKNQKKASVSVSFSSLSLISLSQQHKADADGDANQATQQDDHAAAEVLNPKVCFVRFIFCCLGLTFFAEELWRVIENHAPNAETTTQSFTFSTTATFRRCFRFI